MVPVPWWLVEQAVALGGGSTQAASTGRSHASMPLVSPVVDDCAPRQSFFNGVGAIINSLALQGMISRTGQSSFATHAHLHVVNRDPTVHDDSAHGYAPGHDWYNPDNGYLWKCVYATVAAATWVGWSAAALGVQAENLVYASPNGTPGYPSFRKVKEADFGFTDVTTANSSTSAHGLLRKLSGTATEYLDGSGEWSTPSKQFCLLDTTSGTVSSGGAAATLSWSDPGAAANPDGLWAAGDPTKITLPAGLWKVGGLLSMSMPVAAENGGISSGFIGTTLATLVNACYAIASLGRNGSSTITWRQVFTYGPSSLVISAATISFEMPIYLSGSEYFVLGAGQTSTTETATLGTARFWAIEV